MHFTFFVGAVAVPWLSRKNLRVTHFLYFGMVMWSHVVEPFQCFLSLKKLALRCSSEAEWSRRKAELAQKQAEEEGFSIENEICTGSRILINIDQRFGWFQHVRSTGTIRWLLGHLQGFDPAPDSGCREVGLLLTSGVELSSLNKNCTGGLVLGRIHVWNKL